LSTTRRTSPTGSGSISAEKCAEGIEPQVIVILSGINMPGMDELEPLREIKQWRPDPAVIMMSPYGGDEWRRRNWRIRRCRVRHQASRFRDPEDAAAPTVYRCGLRSSALSRMTALQTSLERGQWRQWGMGRRRRLWKRWAALGRKPKLEHAA
jgi:CheY-like chemotaxis protein